jgi:glycosyltransferase involved in cell wall biosynthesis
MTARPRIVVVLSMFPLYDELFLLRELVALAREVDLYVFSLRRSRQAFIHPEARALLEKTLSLSYVFSWVLVRAQLAMLRRRPGSYFRALFGLIRANLRSPEFLLKNLLFFPKAVALAVWARDLGASHLHAGWATYPASAALVASELTGLPYSFSGHAHDIYEDTTQLAEKIRRAAFVTTCTEGNRAHLLSVAPDVAPDRVAVLHHGLVLADFAAPHRAASRPLELLSVGTLYAHKGFGHLIEALFVLAGRGLDFRCTLAGDGPLRRELEELARRRGISERVVFTGALPQPELVPLYRRAAVFVLMAQSEWHWGIPNVIVEALAARAAVITTRFGSVEELVRDRETGLIVPAKDPAALAAAIETLAGDDGLRRRLAEAGHQRVAEAFDLRLTVQGYLERFGVRPATPSEAAGLARAAR